MVFNAHAQRVYENSRQHSALVLRTVDETFHRTSHPPTTTYTVYQTTRKEHGKFLYTVHQKPTNKQCIAVSDSLVVERDISTAVDLVWIQLLRCSYSRYFNPNYEAAARDSESGFMRRLRVHMFVCLSVAKLQKKRDFLKNEAI